jgi:hypothetical protein
MANIGNLLVEEAIVAKKSSKELLKEIEKSLAELNRRIGDSVPVDQLKIEISPNEALVPPYTLLLEQFAICTRGFFAASQDKLISKGFTHILTVEGLAPVAQLQRYRHLLINPSSITKSTDVIRLVPKVFDFIREIYQFKGKLLMIEDRTNLDKLYLNSVVVREAILYSLACLFKCSVYEMWMLINNQVT